VKKDGRIKGHFGKIDKGRPMKPKVNQILIGGNAPMNKTKQDVIQAGKKGVKGSCANWNLPENFYGLKSQVILYIRSKGDKDNDENTGIISSSTTTIPRTTLQQISKRLFAASQQKNVPLEQATREMIFPKCREVEMASWMTIKLNHWARPSHTGTKQTMGCPRTRLFLLSWN